MFELFLDLLFEAELFYKSVEDLKTEMETAHQKTDENLSFIKENLFNPHEGLWAETKLNSQFRKDSQKWRGVIGTGFVGLFYRNSKR